MGTNLSALTQRQIDAEEALRKGGYHRDAAALRVAWNHTATHRIEDILAEFEGVASLASAHPCRSTLRPRLRAPEPAPNLATHIFDQLSDNAYRGGWHSYRDDWRERVEERRRRAVD